MKPIEITISEKRWPLEKIAAITFPWPFIFYREGYQDRAITAHEHYHWSRIWRWGVVPWYVAYVVLALIYRTGGKNHPLERRGYAIADEVRATYCCCEGSDRSPFKFCAASFDDPHCYNCGQTCQNHLRR